MDINGTLHCGHSGLLDNLLAVASGFSAFRCRDSEVAHFGQVNSSLSAVTMASIGVPHRGQGVAVEPILWPVTGSTLALQTPAVA